MRWADIGDERIARGTANTFADAVDEADAEVTATGPRTKFGRTAELVRTAHVVSSQQKAVLRVVRNLAVFNGGVIVLMVGYAWYLKLPVTEIIPLVLTAVLASIPVASVSLRHRVSFFMAELVSAGSKPSVKPSRPYLAKR